MIPAGQLTMDDLELAAFKFGGTIEPRPGNRFVLVGALIGGRRVTLGPVAGQRVA
jgi:hypothetical protein